MAQHTYHNDINKLQTLDGELTTKIKPRWVKKHEKGDSMNNSTANYSKLSLSTSVFNNSLALGNTSLYKTPNKQKNAENGTKIEKKTPGKRKINVGFKTSSYTFCIFFLYKK